MFVYEVRGRRRGEEMGEEGESNSEGCGGVWMDSYAGSRTRVHIQSSPPVSLDTHQCNL